MQNYYKILTKKDKQYSICSCGLSKKLPYCDNTHRKVNKEKGTCYKSIKIKLNKDNILNIRCSNWDK